MQNIKATLYRILSVVFYEHAFLFLSGLFFVTAFTRTNPSDMFPLLGIAAIMSALDTIMSQLRELNQYNDEKHIAKIERNHRKNMDMLKRVSESIDNIKFEIEEK
jgi:hypothetical protein